jgi:hypothetical protein
MTAPAHDNDVSRESFGLTEHGGDRRLVDDDDVEVPPAAREDAPRMVGGDFGATVESGQHARPPVFHLTAPRHYDAYARLGRPRKVTGGSNGSPGNIRPICRDDDAKFLCSSHSGNSVHQS